MTERMQFVETRSGLFIAPGGWAIRRDGSESPAYWTAYRPAADDNVCLSPSHELGAGAGDEGWLKCVRLCELELRSRQPGYAESMTAAGAAQPGVGVSSNGNSSAKSCESNSNGDLPLQQGLGL